MDLWELTKLVFRRWLVSVPMLVALAVGLMAMQATISPDYEAVAHVQLIPPQVQPNEDSATEGAKNPWAQLGADALGQAVVVSMQRPSLAKSLADEGLSGEFTVALDPYFPIVVIEVIGDSPEQATATAQRLATIVVEAVQSRQDVYSVSSEKAITTLLLDDGSDLTPNNSSKRRAMVAVAGLGVLLTGATAVAVDALIYRRRRRRAGAPGREPWPAPYRPAPFPTTGHNASTASASVSPTSPAPPVSPAVVADMSHLLREGSTPSAGRFPRPPDSGNSAPSTGDDEPDARNEDSPSGYPATPSGSLPYDDDSTIVLPLKHARWPKQQSDNR